MHLPDVSKMIVTSTIVIQATYGCPGLWYGRSFLLYPCTFNALKNRKYVNSITTQPMSPDTVVIFTSHPKTSDELLFTFMYASGISRHVAPTA
jgi:hypothetical protein